MKKINWINAYTSNGYLHPELLFIEFFDVIPNIYNNYSRTKYAFTNIKDESFKHLISDVIFIRRINNFNYDSENTIMIITQTIICTIIENKIRVYYPPSVNILDIENFVQKLDNSLPKI